MRLGSHSVGTNRVVGVVALLALPVVVTLAWHVPATHAAARACCAYRPVRLLHGDVVPLVGSAFLLLRPRLLGPTMFFVGATFVPYVLARGGRRALFTFLAGHVVATATVAAVALPAAAAGIASATRLAHGRDVGMSAGLAACAGALAVFVMRRHRIAGATALTLLLAYYAKEQVVRHDATSVQHVVALSVGIFLEWRSARVRTPRVAASRP
jgi:hypothetical protein